MKHIANALAAQGRYGDSELLHVTKPELAAINRLSESAGLGSLPRNPTTGLPEASLLSAVLPIVGAVVGGYIGGPAGAAAGGALGGAGGAKISGGDPLLGAVLGGVGGYVGAGGLSAEAAPAAVGATGANLAGEQTLAQTIQGAGAGTAAGAAAPTAATGIQTLPTAAQAAGTAPLSGQIAEGYFGGQAAAPLTGQIAEGYAPQAAASAPPALLNWAAKNPVQAYTLGMGAYRALAGPQTTTIPKRNIYMAGASRPGITQLGVAPTYGGPEQQYFTGNELYNFTQAPGYTVQRYADGGAVTPRYTLGQAAPAQLDAGTPRYSIATPQPGFTAATVPAPQVAYTYTQPNMPNVGTDWYAKAAEISPSYIGQQQVAQQERTLASLDPTTRAQVSGMTPQQLQDYLAEKKQVDTQQATAIKRAQQAMQYAKGGILNLKTHRKSMDPMFIRGMGDGMSDSVPAKIDGDGRRQDEPIRVADGEYIIPADAVAHLGNGSSNAGSKKLDAMVSRVRKARTGKTKQAPEVKAERMMPR